MKAYDIDRLIFEALVNNSSPAAEKINEIIHNEFMNIASETDLTVLPEEGMQKMFYFKNYDTKCDFKDL